MPPSHAPAMSDHDEFSQFSTGLQPFCFVCAGTPTYTSVEMAEEIGTVTVQCVISYA